MTDQRPPRVRGDERETLCALLRFQRESLVRKVSGLDDAAARQSPVASGTSLLWLVEHLAWAERSWLLGTFAGQVEPGAGPKVASEGTLEQAVASYRDTWTRCDEVVAAAGSLDELSRLERHGDRVTLRWILMHLLEEVARHAGHADILRELIDGSVGR